MKRIAFISATKLSYLIVAVLLTACGSGGGGSTGGSPDVTITGRVYNQGSGKALLEHREMAVANTPYSILNATAPDLATLERFNDVSQGSFVTVEIYADNDGETDLTDLSFEIGVEDNAFLTREGWNCLQCFDYGPESEGCNVVNTVQGGYFYNGVAAPDWTCSGEPQWLSGYCYDTFPPGMDCLSESHRWSYDGPGTGLWGASGSIRSLLPGNTFTTTAGFSHSAMDIRPAHLAWFSVKDSDGAILAQKFYIFDVTP